MDPITPFRGPPVGGHSETPDSLSAVGSPFTVTRAPVLKPKSRQRGDPSGSPSASGSRSGSGFGNRRKRVSSSEAGGHGIIGKAGVAKRTTPMTTTTTKAPPSKAPLPGPEAGTTAPDKKSPQISIKDFIPVTPGMDPAAREAALEHNKRLEQWMDDRVRNNLSAKKSRLKKMMTMIDQDNSIRSLTVNVTEYAQSYASCKAVLLRHNLWSELGPIFTEPIPWDREHDQVMPLREQEADITTTREKLEREVEKGEIYFHGLMFGDRVCALAGKSAPANKDVMARAMRDHQLKVEECKRKGAQYDAQMREHERKAGELRDKLEEVRKQQEEYRLVSEKFKQEDGVGVGMDLDLDQVPHISSSSKRRSSPASKLVCIPEAEDPFVVHPQTCQQPSRWGSGISNSPAQQHVQSQPQGGGALTFPIPIQATPSHSDSPVQRQVQTQPQGGGVLVFPVSVQTHVGHSGSPQQQQQPQSTGVLTLPTPLHAAPETQHETLDNFANQCKTEPEGSSGSDATPPKMTEQEKAQLNEQAALAELAEWLRQRADGARPDNILLGGEYNALLDFQHVGLGAAGAFGTTTQFPHAVEGVTRGHIRQPSGSTPGSTDAFREPPYLAPRPPSAFEGENWSSSLGHHDQQRFASFSSPPASGVLLGTDGSAGGEQGFLDQSWQQQAFQPQQHHQTGGIGDTVWNPTQQQTDGYQCHYQGNDSNGDDGLLGDHNLGG